MISDDTEQSLPLNLWFSQHIYADNCLVSIAAGNKVHRVLIILVVEYASGLRPEIIKLIYSRTSLLVIIN